MNAEVANSREEYLRQRNRRRTMRRLREAPVYAFLFGCALLSIVTTLGILFVLFDETVSFFDEVSLREFLTGTEWTPLFIEKSFGVLPLLNATLFMAAMAMLVAVPLGLLSAIYLSEYADPRVRSTIKPVL